MGPRGFVSMDPEVELEMQEEMTRRMEESARADFVAYVNKVREHTMLITMNQNMLAQEAPKESFVAEFMVFLEAIENGDLATLRRCDEKDMMNTISKMMNSDAGDEYGDNFLKTKLGLEEKASIVTMVKNNGSFGDDYEREGAMVDSLEKPNSDRNGLYPESPVNMAAAPNETATS